MGDNTSRVNEFQKWTRVQAKTTSYTEARVLVRSPSRVMIERKFGNQNIKTKIGQKPDSFKLVYTKSKSSTDVHETWLKCSLFVIKSNVLDTNALYIDKI